jgi:hypothetical protein
MRKVYRYPLGPPSGGNVIAIPVGARIVEIDIKPRELEVNLWVELPSTYEKEKGTIPVRFRQFTTGEDIPPKWNYLRTVTRVDGIVIHVYGYSSSGEPVELMKPLYTAP